MTTPNEPGPTSTQQSTDQMVGHPTMKARPQAFNLPKLNQSKLMVIAFSLLFAAVGSFFLYNTFAASLPQELGLANALKNLNQKRPAKVVATTSIDYRGSKNLSNISLTTTTNVDIAGNTDTKANLKLTSPNKSVTPVSFPLEVQTFDDAPSYAKVGNTSAVKAWLPSGSSLRNWLDKQPVNVLARLENNWYLAYPSDNLGCFPQTFANLSQTDLSNIGKAYGSHPALSITRQTTNGQTTYTVQPKAGSANDFVNNVAQRGFVKQLNSCAQKYSHANATDKVLGAVATTQPIAKVVVDRQGRISQISFSNPGSPSSKSTISITANFSYGPLHDEYGMPYNSGIFDPYYQSLVHPSDTQKNSQFTYKLASGWGADNCFVYKNGADIYLFPDGPSKGPYCGPSWAFIGSSTPNTKQPDDPQTGSALPNNPVKSQLTHGQQLASAATDCTQDTQTLTDVVIDGKKMGRQKTVYGDCREPFIPAGSIEVDYCYPQSACAAVNANSWYFYAAYLQKPKDVDRMAAYEAMVKSVHLKWSL